MSPQSIPPASSEAGTSWELPPLILHPFNEQVSPSALLNNSKAALMLSGLMPRDGTDSEELARRVLAGRYSEVRMLFFLGKDIFRWIDQCMEWAERIPALRQSELYHQSFAGLLTESPPAAVSEKLIQWGVTDHLAIFSRAIGLNALFAGPPGLDLVSEGFLRGYHRYADFLYRCYMDSQPHRRIEAANFRFQLFASGEYSRLLESEWEASEN